MTSELDSIFLRDKSMRYMKHKKTKTLLLTVCIVLLILEAFVSEKPERIAAAGSFNLYQSYIKGNI